MPDHRTVRLTFRGDLDIHRRDEVAAMLPAPGSADEVVLDFSDVMFIDSTILTVLLRYRRAFEEAGGDPINIVIIANAHGRRFLDIAGVSQSLTVVTALGS
jgi:anti-anti-sigma factor